MADERPLTERTAAERGRVYHRELEAIRTKWPGGHKTAWIHHLYDWLQDLDTAEITLLLEDASKGVAHEEQG